MDKVCTCVECLKTNASGLYWNPSKFKAHIAMQALRRRNAENGVDQITSSLNNVMISGMASSISQVSSYPPDGTHLCKCNECISSFPLGQPFLSHDYRGHLGRISAGQQPPLEPPPRTVSQHSFTSNVLPNKHDRSVRTTNVLERFHEAGQHIHMFNAKLDGPLTPQSFHKLASVSLQYVLCWKVPSIRQLQSKKVRWSLRLYWTSLRSIFR